MIKKGFTLIELLVVIAVIALLLAILLPTLRLAKKQAKTALCLSNIHHLNLALTSFEMDTDAYPYAFSNLISPPPPGGYVGSSAPNKDRMGWWWFHFLGEYIGQDTRNARILRCPDRNIPEGSSSTNLLMGNYGVNLSICTMDCGGNNQKEFVGKPLNAELISAPSNTLLLLDCGYVMISWNHAADVPPSPLNLTHEDAAYVPGLKINQSRSLFEEQQKDAVEGRHENYRLNVGFVDGQCRTMDAESLLVEKVSDTFYKNQTPLWKPVK
jgi:prepilin-type N-terminal cleavage/methylation domain-containing protein